MPRYNQFRQLNENDCGPAAVGAFLASHGLCASLAELRQECGTDGTGSNLLGIKVCLERHGFSAFVARWTLQEIVSKTLPFIALYTRGHYVVVLGVGRKKVRIFDPERGGLSIDRAEFIGEWEQDGRGIAVAARPTGIARKGAAERGSGNAFRRMLLLARPYWGLMSLGLLLNLCSSFLGLLAALCSQAIVDKGISSGAIGVVGSLCIAILLLAAARLVADSTNSWIMFHVGSRINTGISGRYIKKLLTVKDAYISSRTKGDVLQRVQDAFRIRRFFVQGAVQSAQSLLVFALYSIVLLVYSQAIYVAFMIGSVLGVLVTVGFGYARRSLDLRITEMQAKKNDQVNSYASGHLEIRGFELAEPLASDWEETHVEWHELQRRSVSIKEAEKLLSGLINECKNATVLYYSATAVIAGELSIGMMFAIAYVIGQLNQPIGKVIDLVKSFEEAMLSFRRISEVLDEPLESESMGFSHAAGGFQLGGVVDLNIESLRFGYGKGGPPTVDIQDLSFEAGDSIAVVGASGSGKSTLIKLLAGILPADRSAIYIGEVRMSDISLSEWRRHLAVSFQNAFLFDDSVEANITSFSRSPDAGRLWAACQLANIDAVISSLPLKARERLGGSRTRLSGGERQRIGIARTLYRNGRFLLLDEATGALDAVTEKLVLQGICASVEATKIVVTHRISAVRDFDKIVVLDQGRVAGHGSHAQLMEHCEVYRRLAALGLQGDS